MSNYLQFNNHMILHPTDPSKYFGSVIEPPNPILLGAKYLTYFDTPTPSDSSHIYTWVDNPVICVPANTPLSTDHMATGYSYSGYRINNELVQLDGNYSNKTGIKSDIPRVGAIYTIDGMSYSNMGLDTHFDFQSPNSYKTGKSIVFRFKVDLSNSVQQDSRVASFGMRMSYYSWSSSSIAPGAGLYHLDCWYDSSNSMGLDFYVSTLNHEEVQSTLTLYNGATYPSTRSYASSSIQKHYLTIPGVTKSIWHQCAIVLDNEYMYIFIDGVLYASCRSAAPEFYGAGCEGCNNYGSNYSPAYMTELLVTDYDIRTSPTTCMTWDTPLV